MGGRATMANLMPSETVENYLKTLLALCDESPTGEAAPTRLAAALNVTKGTATAMVKRLVAGKLVRAKRYGGVTLTSKGRLAAADVLRRHRLLETFLVQILHVDWADVHEEAERLEHAVSPRLLSRIDEILGRPSVDPHGDPIPGSDGVWPPVPGMPLSDVPVGANVTIRRITVQDREFLYFIARAGLKPGTNVSILAHDHHAGAMLVEPSGHAALTLSANTASTIHTDAPAKVNNRPRTRR